MNPDPVPRGMVKMLRLQKSMTRSEVDMYTTESRERSNSSMVDFSSAARSPRAVTVRGAADSFWNARSAHDRACQANRTVIRAMVSQRRRRRNGSIGGYMGIWYSDH